MPLPLQHKAAASSHAQRYHVIVHQQAASVCWPFSGRDAAGAAAVVINGYMALRQGVLACVDSSSSSSTSTWKAYPVLHI
jgi:hypothetical protein